MLRDDLIRLLNQTETEDTEPPFRCLPVGHRVWAEIKADRILALIDAQRCVWTLDDGSKTWESSCGLDGMADPKTFDLGEFPFCPCCGKRIELKEGEDG